MFMMMAGLLDLMSLLLAYFNYAISCAIWLKSSLILLLAGTATINKTNSNEKLCKNTYLEYKFKLIVKFKFNQSSI